MDKEFAILKMHGEDDYLIVRKRAIYNIDICSDYDVIYINKETWRYIEKNQLSKISTELIDFERHYKEGNLK